MRLAGSKDDPSSEEGVSRIAEAIDRYWRSRGYPGIRVRVVATLDPSDGKHLIYGVRSNIGSDGYPPRT